MSGVSIRRRLAGWYLVVLATATAGFAAGSWTILERSIRNSADATLRQRIDDVGMFIDRAHRALSRDEFLDEFREYAELTPGDALLEVRDDEGTVLCRPRLQGWDVVSSQLVNGSLGPLPVFVKATLGQEPVRAAGARLPIGL